MTLATNARIVQEGTGDGAERSPSETALAVSVRARRTRGASVVLLTWLAVVLCLVAIGCVREPRPEPPPPPPETPTPSLVEEDLPPDETIQIEIIDLQPRLTEDHSRVVAEGVLINRGTKVISQLTIIVSAVDAEGMTLASVDGIPESESVPAGGGTVKFSAVMDYMPEAVEYQAHAVAR